MRVGRRWGGWMRERAAVCADCGVSFSAKRCAAGHERRHGGRFRSPLHGLPPLRLSFHGEQAMFFCRAGAGLVPNGGRRTDGCLRRPRPPGADGRRVALSDRTALYNNVYCLAKAFPSAHHPMKSPHRRPNGRRWGRCCGRASARRALVFSLCRRAYRPFSWSGGRRRSLFRRRVRPLRSWWWAHR